MEYLLGYTVASHSLGTIDKDAVVAKSGMYGEYNASLNLRFGMALVRLKFTLATAWPAQGVLKLHLNQRVSLVDHCFAE